MDIIELAIQIENTAMFIDAKPTDLALISKTRVRTPAGGYTWADGPIRPAQTFRIIELGTETAPPQVKLQDGKVRSVSFWLLATPDVVVERGDHWTADDGRVWEVADVIRSNEYEIRAVVVESGA